MAAYTSEEAEIISNRGSYTTKPSHWAILFFVLAVVWVALVVTAE